MKENALVPAAKHAPAIRALWLDEILIEILWPPPVPQIPNISRLGQFKKPILSCNKPQALSGQHKKDSCYTIHRIRSNRRCGKLTHCDLSRTHKLFLGDIRDCLSKLASAGIDAVAYQ
jgi:hypothetical protein